MTRYLKGDPIKNARWTALLIKKMERMNVEYIQYLNPWDYDPSNACMTVPAKEVWDCKRPILKVGSDYADWENEMAIPTILHELGHILDLRRARNSMMDLVRRKGSLEMEVSAWENAFKMAREIGYTNFKLMEEDAVNCMSSYFNATERGQTLPADSIVGFRGTPPTRAEGTARMKQARIDAERAHQLALFVV